MAARPDQARKALNLLRTRFAPFHNVAEIYMPSIARKKARVIELLKEQAERAAQSEMGRKWRVVKGFYTLEMAPPTSAEEMKKLTSDLALAKKFIESGAYRYITVRQAWLLFLVGTEVGLWFYLGETIGKMHIVGYKV